MNAYLSDATDMPCPPFWLSWKDSWGVASFLAALAAIACIVVPIIFWAVDALTDGWLVEFLTESSFAQHGGEFVVAIVSGLPLFSLFPAVGGFVLGRVGRYEEGWRGRLGQWGFVLSQVVFFAVVYVPFPW